MVIAIALALAAQTVAAAAAPTAAAPAGQQRPTPQQQLEAMASALKARGMSADGVNKVQASLVSGAQGLRSFAPRVEAAHAALTGAVSGGFFDSARFEAALKMGPDIDAAIVRYRSDHQLQLFRSLSPADKKVFALVIASTLNRAR